MKHQNIDTAPEWVHDYLDEDPPDTAVLWWDEVVPGNLALDGDPFVIVGLADAHGTILAIKKATRGIPLTWSWVYDDTGAYDEDDIDAGVAPHGRLFQSHSFAASSFGGGR